MQFRTTNTFLLFYTLPASFFGILVVHTQKRLLRNTTVYVEESILQNEILAVYQYVMTF